MKTSAPAGVDSTVNATSVASGFSGGAWSAGSGGFSGVATGAAAGAGAAGAAVACDSFLSPPPPIDSAIAAPPAASTNTAITIHLTFDDDGAGAIVAALFLQEFVSASTPWAHLDLMAWNSTNRPGRPEGGEAMGLRALYALIAEQAAVR